MDALYIPDEKDDYVRGPDGIMTHSDSDPPPGTELDWDATPSFRTEH